MIGRVTFVEERTYRLIPTARHKPPVLDALASSYDAKSKLEALESVTSGRQVVQQRGVPGIEPGTLAAGYGYTYINAAFAYRRPEGNRFNPGEWGAWYASFDVDTSLREVAFHLTRALAGAGGDYDNTTSYIELLSDFQAEFHDLRDLPSLPSCLSEDTSIGYSHGQELGIQLRAAGANGIVYPSVRHTGGTCLVAFWPGLIQNFQFGETWTLRWAGDPTPKKFQGTRQ